MAMEKTTNIDIVNDLGMEVTFHLEPWGRQYPMSPGEAFTVVGQGPPDGDLELRIEPNAIIVWGWGGSVVTVFRDGEELDF